MSSSLEANRCRFASLADGAGECSRARALRQCRGGTDDAGRLRVCLGQARSRRSREVSYLARAFGVAPSAAASCAVLMLQATHDIRKVALWLGHADIRTTEVYLRMDASEKLEAVEAVVPPELRRGRFKAPDALIASLLEDASTSDRRQASPCGGDTPSGPRDHAGRMNKSSLLPFDRGPGKSSFLLRVNWLVW